MLIVPGGPLTMQQYAEFLPRMIKKAEKIPIQIDRDSVSLAKEDKLLSN